MDTEMFVLVSILMPVVMPVLVLVLILDLMKILVCMEYLPGHAVHDSLKSRW